MSTETISDWIAESVEAEAKKREAARTAYLKFARRLSTGKISDKDKAASAAICEAAGKELTELKADVAILQKLAQHHEHAAKIPGAQAELEQANASCAAHAAETRRIIEERAKAEAILSQASQTAGSKLAEAMKADKEAKAIEAEHHELVGAPDPVQLAKRRHLAIVRRDQKIDTDIEIVNAASIFASGERSGLFTDQSIEWLPAPGQTQEQLNALLHICRQWIAGKIKRPTFLVLEGETDPNLSADSKLILFENIVADQIKRTPKADEPAYSFDITEYTIVALPDQREARLAEAVAHLADVYAKHPGTRRKKEIDDWRARQEENMQPGAHIEMMQKGPRRWDGSSDGTLQPVG